MVFQRGKAYSQDLQDRVFASKMTAAALVEIEPGALRELHWFEATPGLHQQVMAALRKAKEPVVMG